MNRLIFSSLFAWATVLNVSAADPVFSGRSLVKGPRRSRHWNLPERMRKRARSIADNTGAPTALVFLHALERSSCPPARDRSVRCRATNRLRVKLSFSQDRLEGEQRMKAAARSLKLQSMWGSRWMAPKDPATMD
jgi:hypothetical protein